MMPEGQFFNHPAKNNWKNLQKGLRNPAAQCKFPPETSPSNLLYCGLRFLNLC